jgi:hypothetical protein
MFRVLLAEIISESVCRKILLLEAKERPWDFPWARINKPEAIADDVLARMHDRITEFVAKAHAVMLRDQEIDKS